MQMEEGGHLELFFLMSELTRLGDFVSTFSEFCIYMVTFKGLFCQRWANKLSLCCVKLSIAEKEGRNSHS